MSKHRTILQDIDDLEVEVRKCVRDVAKETFKQVVHASPTPVDSKGYSVGSYVLSHNVTFTGAADVNIVELTSEDVGAANKALAKANKIKLLDIVLGNNVVISNSTKYNNFVEYTSWFGEGPKGPYHGTPPYAPYRNAYQAGDFYSQSRAKQVK